MDLGGLVCRGVEDHVEVLVRPFFRSVQFRNVTRPHGIGSRGHVLGLLVRRVGCLAASFAHLVVLVVNGGGRAAQQRPPVSYSARALALYFAENPPRSRFRPRGVVKMGLKGPERRPTDPFHTDMSPSPHGPNPRSGAFQSRMVRESTAQTRSDLIVTGRGHPIIQSRPEQGSQRARSLVRWSGVPASDLTVVVTGTVREVRRG
jgi:hypothetical protein